MALSRLSMITLGFADLQPSTAFHRAVFGVAPNDRNEGVVFFELPGTWVALYPLDKLAKDISPDLLPERGPFSGVTLAHNARSKEQVVAIFDQARAAGARIVKPPQDTFWGGFSGYFAAPDGHYWEVAWGPMFDFAPGTLRFKPEAAASAA